MSFHFPREFDADLEIETDVVIVGAGPGGGAAAHQLARAGRRVVVLESGGYYAPGQFPKDGRKALKDLYQDSGQRFTTGNTFFATMFGKGVGGGGLVNSGISFRPPERTIERWADEAQLEEFTSAALAPYVDDVLKNVNIEVQELGRLGGNNTIFKKGLDALGYKGAIVPRNTRGCNACAICFFGCPSGAKQSVDKNFIATAIDKGAEVYTFARVARIDVNKKTNKFESLMAVIHDADTGAPRARLTVNAKHVVMAAGAIGTPQLLMREKICNSSGQVGRNFRCHPSVGAIGIYDEPIMGFKSVQQGYYSDHFFDKEILLETFWAPPGVFATFLPGFGAGPTALMKDLAHFAGAGGMIRDTSSGVVKFEGDKIQIEYNCNQKDQELLTETLFHTIEVLVAAGAKKVYSDNAQKTEFTSLDETRKFFSKVKNLGPGIIQEGNHGMGTCRMGKNPNTSVVNNFGRSHDVENLWIFDVSQFPGALGVNPQITIMALALRGASYLDRHFS